MTREYWEEQHIQLNENLSTAEIKRDEASDEMSELIASGEGNTPRYNELEQLIDELDEEIEEIEDELRHMCSSYDEYENDRRCAYEEEMGEF